VSVEAFSIMRGTLFDRHAECDFRRGTATSLACYYTGKINSPSVRARADATSTHGIANSSRFMHVLNNVPDTCVEHAHTLHMGFRSSAVVVDAWPTLCLTNLPCENDTTSICSVYACNAVTPCSVN